MIGRARILLLLSLVVSLAIVGAELPVGQLLHVRSAITTASGQLSKLDQENAALSQQVSALNQASTIERLAHAQFNLVKPGQRAYVILPSSGATGGSNPLSGNPLQPSQIVPTDAGDLPPSSPPVRKGDRTGLWGQVVGRLEFWRWAF